MIYQLLSSPLLRRAWATHHLYPVVGSIFSISSISAKRAYNFTVLWIKRFLEASRTLEVFRIRLLSDPCLDLLQTMLNKLTNLRQELSQLSNLRSYFLVILQLQMLGNEIQRKRVCPREQPHDGFTVRCDREVAYLVAQSS